MQSACEFVNVLLQLQLPPKKWLSFVTINWIFINNINPINARSFAIRLIMVFIWDFQLK